jgi:hypothetical protein
MKPEIVQALKENTSAFGLMTPELRQAAEEIGADNFEIRWAGDWQSSEDGIGYSKFDANGDYVYRLCPDYNPEPELDKYMVELFKFGKMKGLGVCLGGLPISIVESATAPDFYRFETESGDMIGIEQIATYIAPKDKGGQGGKVFVVLRKA